CCLGASLTYAFAGVYARRFRGIDPVVVATGQVTAGSVLLIPLVLLFDQPWCLPMPDAGVWAALVGLAVLSTVFAYVLYFAII
ncbi:EamA family transporter, partial [Klebsiella pneumoniae]|uniref:EamA family transporter n=1 Tax=Klebsiella pneumoniae TaxID=573 RepID=UPI003EDF580E